MEIVNDLIKQASETFTHDKETKDRNMKAFYYDLCSLYYSSAKDFNNFKVNLTNRQLPLDYTKIVLSSQDAEENRKMQYYNDIHLIVQKFIQNSTDWDKIPGLDISSLVLAITNAIVPELLAQEKMYDLLFFYKNVKEMQKLSSCIKEGKKITRISFDLDTTSNACVLKNLTCVNSFYNDLVRFSSYRMHLPDNIDDEIARLDSQTNYSINRITYRICMVLVHYGILKVITPSNKYILKDENGNQISLGQDIMVKVSILLNDLRQKLKERENEYGSPTNTKYIAEKIKNLLRAGKKDLGDTFDYKDITDTFWGCFVKCDITNIASLLS